MNYMYLASHHIVYVSRDIRVRVFVHVRTLQVLIRVVPNHESGCTRIKPTNQSTNLVLCTFYLHYLSAPRMAFLFHILSILLTAAKYTI